VELILLSGDKSYTVELFRLLEELLGDLLVDEREALRLKSEVLDVAELYTESMVGAGPLLVAGLAMEVWVLLTPNILPPLLSSPPPGTPLFEEEAVVRCMLGNC
jgi:hypothetical protein